MSTSLDKPINPLIVQAPHQTQVGVWSRLVALFIDLLCFSLVESIAQAILQGMFGGAVDHFTLPNYVGWLVFLLVRNLVLYLYQTTPGLSLYGLKAVRLDNLQPPSFKLLMARTLFQCIGVLIFSLWFNRPRRTVYDTITNTVYMPEFLLVLGQFHRTADSRSHR